MNLQTPPPVVTVAVLILVLIQVPIWGASGSVMAGPERANLVADWPEQAELPPPGQALLQINDQVLVFDDITTCGVVEDGRGFLMRAERTDENGRLQTFRIYRRLSGNRTAMSSEEDLVQLAVRGHDNVWNNALMRMQRQSDESLIRLHGNAEGWPAVRVRKGGTGAWASGEMARQAGSSDVVPAGQFMASVHCP